MSPGDKVRILESLPPKREITNLDEAGRQKVAALKQLLQATDRGSVYEVKVIDGVGRADRRIRAIRHPDFEVSVHAARYRELRGGGGHDIRHEDFTVDYESAFRTRDHRRLKDLELLCDAVGIVMVHRLGMNPARFLGAVEKITRYNRKRFPTTIDGTNYPTIAERRSFARRVTAWLQKAGLATDTHGTPRTLATDSRRASRGWRARRNR